MSPEQATVLFTGTGFQVERLVPITNQYWPCADVCREIAYKSPWYIVVTNLGVFMVGWRKRVIEITAITEQPVEFDKVIEDKVTKEKQLVHAWSYDKAIAYMVLINQAIKRATI